MQLLCRCHFRRYLNWQICRRCQDSYSLLCVLCVPELKYEQALRRVKMMAVGYRWFGTQHCAVWKIVRLDCGPIESAIGRSVLFLFVPCLEFPLNEICWMLSPFERSGVMLQYNYHLNGVRLKPPVWSEICQPGYCNLDGRALNLQDICHNGLKSSIDQPNSEC